MAAKMAIEKVALMGKKMAAKLVTKKDEILADWMVR